MESLTKGDKFTADCGIVEVLELRGNDLLVEIVSPDAGTWCETWNLEHTLCFGFRGGWYKKVNL